MKTLIVGSSTHSRPFYTMGEIDNMCTRELQDVDLYPKEPSPIRIDRYIEKRFRIVPSYEDLGPGILGVTKFGKIGVLEIVITRALSEENSVVGERRVRTTFAHEAGHGLLHGHMFGVTGQCSLFPEGASKAPRVLCRDSVEMPQSKPHGSTWWEIQANLAIGGFLLPKTLVRKALERFLRSSGVFGPERLDDASRGPSCQLFIGGVRCEPSRSNYSSGRSLPVSRFRSGNTLIFFVRDVRTVSIHCQNNRCALLER